MIVAKALIKIYILAAVVKGELNTFELNDPYQTIEEVAVEPKNKIIETENKTREVNVFSYIAAILDADHLLGTGALITDTWILTSANGFFNITKLLLNLSARFGSADYSVGGILVDISHVELHPYYNGHLPDFNVALLRLSSEVKNSLLLQPLNIPMMGQEIITSHFFIASWPKVMPRQYNIDSMEMGILHRIRFCHMHTNDPDICGGYVNYNFNLPYNANNIKCLYSISKESCLKSTGAPVVSQGTVWGVISLVSKECTASNITLATMLTPLHLMWIETIVKSKLMNNKEEQERKNYFSSDDVNLVLIEQ